MSVNILHDGQLTRAAGNSSSDGWNTLANKPFESLGTDFNVPTSGTDKDKLKLNDDIAAKLNQFDSSNKLLDTALQTGTQNKLGNVPSTPVTSSDAGKVPTVQNDGTVIFQTPQGGGHEMVTGVENLAAVTEVSNKVANAKTITEWSNVEMARICVRYLATGNNTIGTWVDNQASESWDESDWVKSTKLHGILANSTPDDEIKISISTKVPSGKSAPFSGYSYRLDDAYDATRGAIAIKFNEKATANTEVYITLTRTRTNTEIVTL